MSTASTTTTTASPTSTTVRLGDADLTIHVWNNAPPKNDAVAATTTAGYEYDAICVIYHGLNAHGLYPTVRLAAETLLAATSLNQQTSTKTKFLIVAPDMRGHGTSSGMRGYLLSVETLITDGIRVAEYACHLGMPTTTTTTTVKKEKPKLFLLGSSMGGAIALSVAQRWDQPVAGIVLLAPMLRLKVGSLERAALYGLSMIAPTLQVIPSSSNNSEKQYRDPAKRKECDDDDRTIKGSCIRIGSASTCVQLAHWIQQPEFVAEYKTPFLLALAEEDVIVDNAGALAFFEAAVHVQDKTLKRYPALHGILCEPAPLVNTIQKDILNWILDRCK